MTENIVTGKKYRILTNAANDVWDRISFWTKAQDVYYNDNTTAEANKAAAILRRSTAYSVGHIAYTPAAPSWVMLRCTTAGTTAATQPTTYSTISAVGTVITDGTAKFTVYDARPNATLSSSVYQIPTMSLVNNLNAELSANGKQFYFDYKNGKYGYNTASNRAAATFVPFGSTEIIVIMGGMVTSGSKSFTVPAGTYYFMACAADSNAYAYRTQARVTVNGSDVVFAEGAGEHCSSRDSTATRTFTSATTITCTVTRTSWNLPGAAGFYKS